MRDVMLHDADLEKILNAIQNDSSLAECFLEMIEASDDVESKLNKGDDAEDAVVGVLNKTGHRLLARWGEKKNIEAMKKAQGISGLRPHEKKKSSGKLA